MNAPEWLARHDGSLRPGLNGSTWHVLLSGHPQYCLVAVPADGQHTCAITQTNNGKRLDAGKISPSIEAALTGGLEELREKLGW